METPRHCLRQLQDLPRNQWIPATDACSWCGAAYEVRLVRLPRGSWWGEAVTRRYDSWPEACRTLKDLEPVEVAIHRRDFIGTYQLARSRATQPGHARLQGLRTIWQARGVATALEPLLPAAVIGWTQVTRPDAPAIPAALPDEVDAFAPIPEEVKRLIAQLIKPIPDAVPESEENWEAVS